MMSAYPQGPKGKT